MNNKNKFYMYLAGVLLISITIGYAVLSSSLNINGKSSISKNTWNVYFDNIQINSTSVNAIKNPVIEDNTSINFEVNLDKPGEFYLFTVDVINAGTIDAMIESVVKEPNFTEEQSKYMNYVVEYENGEQINSNQLLLKDSYVRLKVKVEYRKDILASDLPTEATTLTLGFTLNYVQNNDDENNFLIDNNGKLYSVLTGDINTIGSEICIGQECFYLYSSDDNNLMLLAKKNISLEDSPRQGIASDILYCDTPYWEGFGSTTGDIYNEQSNLYRYVENYKKYLNDLGANIVEARLITYNELIALGCKFSGFECRTEAPDWLYTTSYWIGSAYGSSGVWALNSAGTLFTYQVYSTGFGIKPVIIIPKSELIK